MSSTPKDRVRRRRRRRYVLKYCNVCHKETFSSYAQAQRMARRVLQEHEVTLYIYYCKVKKTDYHLTKMEDHHDRGDVY